MAALKSPPARQQEMQAQPQSADTKGSATVAEEDEFENESDDNTGKDQAKPNVAIQLIAAGSLVIPSVYCGSRG